MRENLKVHSKSIEILKTLVKNSPDKNLTESDLAHEAINFYYAYLGFLTKDKALGEKFELLKVSDTPEKTLREAEKEMNSLISYFSDSAFKKFIELKEVLNNKIQSSSK